MAREGERENSEERADTKIKLKQNSEHLKMQTLW